MVSSVSIHKTNLVELTNQNALVPCTSHPVPSFKLYYLSTIKSNSYAEI
jgi:hypothetical protein